MKRLPLVAIILMLIGIFPLAVGRDAASHGGAVALMVLGLAATALGARKWPKGGPEIWGLGLGLLAGASGLVTVREVLFASWASAARARLPRVILSS